MYLTPDAEEISQVAKSIGLNVGVEEAEQYRPHLVKVLQQVDGFVQSRIVEDKPPVLFPKRGRGYRPSLEEDKYRAWLWKCDIGGSDTGLLAGKTVSFKDHVSVAGIPQVLSSDPLEGYIPDFDATLTTKVLAAGGRVVGKHVMGGFNGDYGAPVNPHHPGHISGGSSSGSGAALAAREVDISFGGDQGGSIRLPAAHCGIYGLKPTFGLISHFGASFGAEMSIDHLGPMARTAEDVARALQAVAGYDPLDPRQTRDVPESIDALSDLDGGVKGLKIGILEEGFAEPIMPEVADAVYAAIDVLQSLGAEITKISIPEFDTVDGAFQAATLEGAFALAETGLFGFGYKGYYPASTIATVYRLWHDQADVMPENRKLDRIAALFLRDLYGGGAYAKAKNARAGYVAAFDRALTQVDILALPTSRTTAPKVAPGPQYTDVEAVVSASLKRNWVPRANGALAVNTKTTNFTGHPSLAVPCAKIDGLPTSLQLIGRNFEDPLLLRAAYAFEQATDWDDITGLV